MYKRNKKIRLTSFLKTITRVVVSRQVKTKQCQPSSKYPKNSQKSVENDSIAVKYYSIQIWCAQVNSVRRCFDKNVPLGQRKPWKKCHQLWCAFIIHIRIDKVSLSFQSLKKEIMNNQIYISIDWTNENKNGICMKMSCNGSIWKKNGNQIYKSNGFNWINESKKNLFNLHTLYAK